MACCLALISYNFARFRNPFEFGFLYQLGRPDYFNPHLSSVNISPGIYYLLLCLPLLEPVFPFFRLTVRPHSLPARYFLEPIAGIISLCPLTLLGLTTPLFLKLLRNAPPVNAIIRAMYLYSGACVLFIAALGLTSQRFEVDFEPFLLFIGCVLTAALLGNLQGFKRTLATAAITVLVVYSITANLAVAIQGPYDQLVQANPGLYCKIARWFSPVEQFRPVLNPKIQIEGSLHFAEGCWPGTQDLISIGEFGSLYTLSVECLSNSRLKLISGNALLSRDVRTVEAPFNQPGVNSMRIEFTPEDRMMTVRWNGATVLKYPLPFLVTARSQIGFSINSSLQNAPRLDQQVILFEGPDRERVTVRNK